MSDSFFSYAFYLERRVVYVFTQFVYVILSDGNKE